MFTKEERSSFKYTKPTFSKLECSTFKYTKPGFSKSERSTFRYWFAHWSAFQMTALNLKQWKFKYLFHDFEKPWIKLFIKDYKKVQKFHRTHNSHHIEYNGKKDYEAMVIDWECSRFTKDSSPRTAREETIKKYNENKLSEIDYINIINVLNKFGL